ncbi:DUF1430 domain-containing protein [Paenibacillus sp. FSL P2-0136]|uniref:DUF1430 domain-containing protein n=1 Tax=Paenibacillus sp. FSL P2-0136 TaxID=2975317 RepID=UPI0030DC8E09
MKKISLLFLVAAFLFSYYTAYLRTDYEEFEKVKNIEQTVGKEFVIPNLPGLASPEEVYPILASAAEASKVNILRAGINYKENDEVEIFKYILLTASTDLFNHFKLTQGRYLTQADTKQTNFYLSTVHLEGSHQIGEIRDFGDNNRISIKPLKSSYEIFPVQGTYYAEAADDKAFNDFINLFVDKANKYYNKNDSIFTAEDFVKDSNGDEMHLVTFPWITILTYLSYAIYGCAVVLLIYYLFNESRRIGILKMHGVSNIRVWFVLVGKLITSVFIFSVTVSFLLALLVKNTSYIFIYTVISNQLKVFLLLIILSLVSHLYIMRIKVISIIKHYKYTNPIIVLNMLIKIGCSILLVLIGLSTWSEYTSINDKQHELKNWEHSKDYGVLYPVNNGYDGDRIFGRDSLFELTSHDELYFLLNKMGAILIETQSYEEDQLLLDRNWKGIRSIKANNNYLQEFPVFDINNEAVQISEDISDWVLLVPEKYRDKEEEIVSFFLQMRKNNMGNDQEFYKKVIPDRIQNQKIDIKWISNNQRIFSFNPKVFPSENNVIVDPIIEVVTESNSVLTDRDSILGRGPGDPLKIKLMNRDPLLTYKTLEPKFKELKVDDNLKYLVTIDQYILEEIYQKQKSMKESLLTIVGLVSGFILLSTQNIIIYFNKNQHKLIVRRLFGTGFFKTYKEYTILFSLVWLVQIVICGVMDKGIEPRMLIVAAILLLFDFIASSVAILLIEKKNKVKVLKGGN